MTYLNAKENVDVEHTSGVSIDCLKLVLQRQRFGGTHSILVQDIYNVNILKPLHLCLSAPNALPVSASNCNNSTHFFSFAALDRLILSVWVFFYASVVVFFKYSMSLNRLIYVQMKPAQENRYGKEEEEEKETKRTANTQHR